MSHTAEVVICGAGIAGISTAYFLAVRHGIRNVLLVDERDPLSLTSDKSTECYRNWWPGPGDAMVSLINRSIDLMEELAIKSGNIFHLNRRGYLYVTGDPAKVIPMQEEALKTSQLGGGPLRIHSGQPNDPDYTPSHPSEFLHQPGGADLILDPALLKRHFPYLTDRAVAALHARRAGWLSAQQLGTYLFDQARASGAQLSRGRVSAVDTRGGQVKTIKLQDGQRVDTPYFVNAAGPFLSEVGRMIGIELPVFSEIHLKVAFNDHLGIVPRQSPLLIWSDSQFLPWSQEERLLLSEDEGTRWLLEELPPGVHTRPEGGADSPVVLMLWEYHTTPHEPVWPPPLDMQYPEIALRGLTAILPDLRKYFGKSPRPVLDGGYYTKTRENRPLIGTTPVDGAYVIGALSGFGVMAGCASGELLAQHITGNSLPSYAPYFSLQRYTDPAYLRLIQDWGVSGQL